MSIPTFAYRYPYCRVIKCNLVSGAYVASGRQNVSIRFARRIVSVVDETAKVVVERGHRPATVFVKFHDAFTLHHMLAGEKPKSMQMRSAYTYHVMSDSADLYRRHMSTYESKYPFP